MRRIVASRNRADASDSWPMTSMPIGWDAKWIEPEEAAGSPSCQRPAYLLAGEVNIPGKVATAELRITARGIYEAFLNGRRVGDQELTPGYTAYRHRLQVQTFDVTELVKEGSNALGVILSDGWWRGQTGFGRTGLPWVAGS